MPAIEKDNIGLNFFTRMNMRQPDIINRFLKKIYELGNEFAPKEFDNGKQWIPFDQSDIHSMVRKWMNYNQILLRRKDKYESEISISMRRAASGAFNTIFLWLEDEYFFMQSHVDNFLQLSMEIYILTETVYGNIHQTRDKLDIATVDDRRYGKTIVPTNLKKGLPNIYWVNFFGFEYVETIGREKFLSAPCERIVELPDGGLMVLLYPSPKDPALARNRAKQEALKSHLGEYHFYRWGQNS